VKPGVDNRGKILRSLRQVAPAGATPISYAMRRAIEDLETTGAREKSVVLISDGMDTCGFDPCALAESLDASGTQAQFNVVGFGTDGKANQQLECIASSTSGRFYTAQTNAKLAESILDGIRYHHSEVKGKILD
jgi:Ca-activated chloride channel family protein